MQPADHVEIILTNGGVIIRINGAPSLCIPQAIRVTLDCRRPVKNMTRTPSTGDFVAEFCDYHPPQRWRAKAEEILSNWSEPHKTAMLTGMAAENDLAESRGFEYEPDSARGHGWGRFRKPGVLVWEAPVHGHGVAWHRADIIAGLRQSTRRYKNLADALQDQNPTHKLGASNYLWESLEEHDGKTEASSSG